jgi:predicted small lipoprotein YifL
MKKVIALLLVLACCLSLCACGEKTPDKPTPEQVVCERAEWDVSFTVTNYGNKGVRAQVTTINEINPNEFEFYGTFSALNPYNATVNGTFKGTGTYNPDSESASVDVTIN